MIRTLIIEDDFRVAEIHAAFVERLAGFVVVGTAHSAAEGVALTASLQPDLVLLDMYLPDRSGLDVLGELRSPERVPVDVIVITAAKDVDTLRAALQSGVTHYLVKPFAFESFRQRLTAYKALHERLAATGDVDQGDIDEIIRLLRTESPKALPKGLSPVTLEVIKSALHEAAGDLSALEVAQRTGASRVTSRRYLDHLVKAGSVVVTMRYGFSGRPEHRYRWIGTGHRAPRG